MKWLLRGLLALYGL